MVSKVDEKKLQAIDDELDNAEIKTTDQMIRDENTNFLGYGSRTLEYMIKINRSLGGSSTLAEITNMGAAYEDGLEAGHKLGLKGEKVGN